MISRVPNPQLLTDIKNKLTAVLAQNALHIFFEILLNGFTRSKRRPKHQWLLCGVHEKYVSVVLLHCDARSLRAKVANGDELLALEPAAVGRPHVQDSDAHAIRFGGGVGGQLLDLALNHHGRSVRLLLQGIQARGVARKGDPDEQHREVHRIKPPHAVGCGSGAAGRGGAGAGAVVSGRTQDEEDNRIGLRRRRGMAGGLRWRGRAADLAQAVPMPSVGAAFPARFRDGGPRDAQEPETAPGSGAGRKRARCCILLQRSPPTPVCVHKLRSSRERRFRKTPLVFLRPVKCYRPGGHTVTDEKTRILKKLVGFSAHKQNGFIQYCLSMCLFLRSAGKFYA